MKCKVVIKLNNTEKQFICTISTISPHTTFKQISNNNKFNCDKITENGKQFIHFTAHCWSFWYFLNELNVSVFYRQCVIQHVNDLNGMPIVQIVQPHHEIIDRDWLVKSIFWLNSRNLIAVPIEEVTGACSTFSILVYNKILSAIAFSL